MGELLLVRDYVWRSVVVWRVFGLCVARGRSARRARTERGRGHGNCQRQTLIVILRRRQGCAFIEAAPSSRIVRSPAGGGEACQSRAPPVVKLKPAHQRASSVSRAPPSFYPWLEGRSPCVRKGRSPRYLFFYAVLAWGLAGVEEWVRRSISRSEMLLCAHCKTPVVTLKTAHQRASFVHFRARASSVHLISIYRQTRYIMPLSSIPRCADHLCCADFLFQTHFRRLALFRLLSHCSSFLFHLIPIR
jgi:hypothetical protein